MEKGQNVLICPRCGGNKVNSINDGKNYLLFTILFAVSIVLIPVAIVFLFIYLHKKNVSKKAFLAICLECKYRWGISKDKFIEQQTIVKNNEKLQA
ncbi:hypothetical protein [Niallia taxi]|uniref:hypothetical protein n=1 Tax=Niallia taxi TaxID=2499688 RepID=UPI0015F4C4F2|nr:hypothetical protein [Niallia taxi]